MTIKIIGKERMQGEFKNQPYDNTMLYCMEELHTQKPHDGYKTHALKVRSKIAHYEHLQVGDYYEVYFDEYKSVAHLNKITRKE